MRREDRIGKEKIGEERREERRRYLVIAWIQFSSSFFLATTLAFWLPFDPLYSICIYSTLLYLFYLIPSHPLHFTPLLSYPIPSTLQYSPLLQFDPTQFTPLHPNPTSSYHTWPAEREATLKRASAFNDFNTCLSFITPFDDPFNTLVIDLDGCTKHLHIGLFCIVLIWFVVFDD